MSFEKVHPEADVYCLISFIFEKGNGTCSVLQAHMGGSTVIAGLKEDLEALLGVPEDQEWYYQSELMKNDKSLIDYGIDGTSSEYEIVVKIKKSEAHMGGSTVIAGLKEDLEALLGVPEDQEWYYQSELMKNDKSLIDYGIDGTSSEYEIVVKIKKSEVIT